MVQVAAAAAAILWFGLNGLLWYAKPSPSVWLPAPGCWASYSSSASSSTCNGRTTTRSPDLSTGARLAPPGCTRDELPTTERHLTGPCCPGSDQAGDTIFARDLGLGKRL